MMTFLDWLIVVVVFGSILVFTISCKRFNRSTVDFLAANRSGRRYLLTVAQSAAAFGAIGLIADFEVFFQAGMSPMFWLLIKIPIMFIIAATGWVIYRYRETRVLTLAQFFELRYSRNFRIFMGLMAFLTGIVNFGIFPAVAANFFIQFCGLPATVVFLGMIIPIFPLLMIFQLSLALSMAISGGQIAVMVSDFLQGQFINVVLVITAICFFGMISWDQTKEVLISAPANASLINPFKTGGVKDFNLWFYLIAMVGAFYNTMAWQGSQGHNACAISPHEARMGAILGQWRSSLTFFLPSVIAIGGLVIMNHPAFHEIAASVQNNLLLIPDAQVRDQMIVPNVLRYVLPAGVIGLFTAMILAASTSTDTTYLHSWGSIFVQDVLIPLRGRPLSPRSHMLALRLAILGVAVFAFFFSLLFKQTEHIRLFFAATGAIFLGGAGSTIIGGLYWKKGTTAGAWTGMIVGSTIAIAGIVIRQLIPSFPINSQVMYFIAIVAAISSYTVVSLIQNSTFDLDRILHRGRYQELLPREERTKPSMSTGWAAIGPDLNFTQGDRFVFWLTTGVQVGLFVAAILVTVCYFIFHFGDSVWLKLWGIFIVFSIVKAIGVTAWFLIGGIGDLRDMLRLLKNVRRDPLDDGMVVEGHNQNEPSMPPSSPK